MERALLKGMEKCIPVVLEDREEGGCKEDGWNGLLNILNIKSERRMKGNKVL